MAEIAEAEQACFYCHVQRTFGHTPSDKEFNLRAVSDDVLFWTDVQMTILSLPGMTGEASLLKAVPRAAPSIAAPVANSSRLLRAASGIGRRVGQELPLWRKLTRTFWEDRRTFNVAKDFFKRWRPFFRRQGTRLGWSGEHMLLKQRWYRGANPWFARGTWQNGLMQGLGDAGWNILPMPHRLNQFLFNHPIISFGFTVGTYYGASKIPGAAFDTGVKLRGWIDGTSDETR